MKKRVLSIVSLLLILCILGGCADEGNMLLSYESNSNNIGYIASITGGSSNVKIDSFADEICVIPKDEVSDEHTKTLTASGLLMVDITDNKMLYSYGIYDKLYPASLTKLATALVCLKYGNMDDDVKISYNASHISEPGAKLCYLQEGDVINFETLLTSFIVYSGNDAGIALAEHISGTEAKFAKLMNKELSHLGAVGTHYVNSHGLPNDNHYTTAYDIYLMLNELAKYDKFREMSSTKEYTAEFKDVNGNPVKKIYDNTNMYLSGAKTLPEGFKIVAGKTGTTTAAGNCLSLVVEGPNGHEYIAICMKAYSYDNLYNQIDELLLMAKK